MMYLNIELFKDLLKKSNMSITSFSKESGIPRDSINNWLYRGSKIPKWKAEMIVEFFEEQLQEEIEDLFI